MEEADVSHTRQLISVAQELGFCLKIVKGVSGNIKGEFHKSSDQEPRSMLVLYNFRDGNRMKTKKQFKFPTQLQKVLRSTEEIKKMIGKKTLTQGTLIEAINLLNSWNTVEKQWIKRCKPNNKNFLRNQTDVTDISQELANLGNDDPIKFGDIEESNELTDNPAITHGQESVLERRKDNALENNSKNEQRDSTSNNKLHKRSTTAIGVDSNVINKKQRLDKTIIIDENSRLAQALKNQETAEDATPTVYPKDPRIPTAAPVERIKAIQIREIAKDYNYIFKVTWGENYRPRGEFYEVGNEKPATVLVFYNFLRSGRLTFERQFKFPSNLQKLIPTVPGIQKMIKNQILPPEAFENATMLDNAWKIVRSEWRKRHSPKGVDIILSVEEIVACRRTQGFERDVNQETIPHSLGNVTMESDDPDEFGKLISEGATTENIVFDLDEDHFTNGADVAPTSAADSVAMEELSFKGETISFMNPFDNIENEPLFEYQLNSNNQANIKENLDALGHPPLANPNLSLGPQKSIQPIADKATIREAKETLEFFERIRTSAVI